MKDCRLGGPDNEYGIGLAGTEVVGDNLLKNCPDSLTIEHRQAPWWFAPAELLVHEIALETNEKIMRVIRSEDRTYVAASHEDPTKPGVLKKVLATKEEIIDGKVQMINWAKLPVGASFRLHYHEDMEETFIMVRGTANMRIADRTFELTKGDTAVVAPREIHEMQNTGDEDVEYVVIGVSTGEDGKTVVVDTT